MMRIQSEPNGRPQPLPRAATGPFKNRLFEAKAQLVTAVLAGQNSYVQGEDAPLRYRLLTDTALRLAELNQRAAYFDLSDLTYQFDLMTWVQNSIRLLAIQLNIPFPTASWWVERSTDDPVDAFVQFLGSAILPQINQPVLLSFDEADQLKQTPLTADFWRLLDQIEMARLNQPAFQKLTIVLWGKSSWQSLAGDGRFTDNKFKQIIL
jgi:hypothetical protein